MSASRKLYTEIADRVGLALRFADDESSSRIVDDVISAVSDALQADNASYDAERFMQRIADVQCFGLDPRRGEHAEIPSSWIEAKRDYSAAKTRRTARGRRNIIESAGDVR